MRKVIIGLVLIGLFTSCNNLNRITDSEISAIRDQTEVLKEQNKILQEISNKLKK